MIIDSSAVVAILELESGYKKYTRAILRASERAISAANYLEAAIVIDARSSKPATALRLDTWIESARIKIEPVTLQQARIARQAYLDYGKGNHPARLNFGDCFAYALAKTTGRPLLFTGNDFSQTDVTAAL